MPKPQRRSNPSAMATPTVSELVGALEAIAPTSLAEPWDNVGLLIGESDWACARVLLTIDLTPAVLAEALRKEASAVVAYHPPIFHAIKRLSDVSPASQLALRLAAARIAVYSPHTALDAAPNGLNDWLASGFGSGDVRALTANESIPHSEQCKVITFVPRTHVEAVRNGLASIGAGRIGNYALCSFEIEGRGTFQGNDRAQPTVGEAGQLEHVDEVRLEMVCPRAALGLAMQAIREFHPYEEPPIEFYAQLPRPTRAAGAGRRIVLDKPASLAEIAKRMKKHLGVDRVHVAAGTNTRAIKTIGLCAGAGGELLDTAIAQGCELFFTGELRHHETLAANARGCAIMTAGHTNTERGYLPELRQRLLSRMPGIEVLLAAADGDPFQVM